MKLTTILAVDDNPANLGLLFDLLDNAGFEILVSQNGQSALKRAKNTHPDIILLDVMMPRKTGFVLFKQLRRNEEYKDIPVIMLTGVADVLEEDESQASGDTLERPFDSLRESLKKAITKMREEGLVRPEMFIDKPIDPDELIVAVKELIGE